MDDKDFKPTPSYGGKECLGNGEHEEIECQCDECEHFLTCFPDATKNLQKGIKQLCIAV